MLTLAFAQTQTAAAPQAQQNPLISLLPIALIFIIFYFLLIRPQKRSQQDHKKMLSELKKNDEVVTSGGVYGTIVNIQEDVITLRVDDNTRIKVQKGSISRLRKDQSSGA
ncbi:MAG: preprotein translocase subunit YajC [Candidatus Omnitrophota bacterium]